jgi:hypothetical protein
LQKATHKYRAQKVTIDGNVFASKKEGKRFSELKLLERAKEISGLTLQPRYPMIVNGRKVCTYVGDFSYLEEKSRKLVCEDVKGFKTETYIVKRKLFLATHPDIVHREI